MASRGKLAYMGAGGVAWPHRRSPVVGSEERRAVAIVVETETGPRLSRSSAAIADGTEAAGWWQRIGGLLVDGGPGTGLADRGRVSHYGLALTRWVAVTGQLFTILFVHFSLGIPLPLAHLLPAVALSVLLNVALAFALGWRVRLSEPAAGALFVYDILQLGYLLWVTGGIQNPFSVLLLVPVGLAAGLLGRAWTVGLTVLTLLVVTLISLGAGGLPWHDGELRLPKLYLVAGWAGISIATVLIAVYAWQFAEEARQRANALAATQLALMREQQMSALGSQAAAAAHLLGSPLGTIAVVAKELARELPESHPLYEDVREIVEQSRRCREILATLGQQRDEGALERLTPVPLSSALAEIAKPFEKPGIRLRIELREEDGTPEPQIALPPEIRHAFANLIDNAIQFAASEVLVTIRPSRSRLLVTIEDDGPGFSPEVLSWLGEPYLSTRHDKGGLGLGVFIAKTLLARTGATMHFDNTRRGARVTLRWPGDALVRAVEEIGNGCGDP